MGLGFGMIFSPAINTATAGVARRDSGVASALVNTMQQVGGSIGTAALSTVALTATTTYLAAHHAGRLAPATAAVHGYTVAFAVSAALFGVGAVVAALLVLSAPAGGVAGPRADGRCRADDQSGTGGQPGGGQPAAGGHPHLRRRDPGRRAALIHKMAVRTAGPPPALKATALTRRQRS